MKPTRRLSRRSFLGRVMGGAAAGGALIVLGSEAHAQVTESDQGPNSDPPGRGRGVSDTDQGPNSDPPGGGRSRRPCSDSDSGPNSDPGGRGRGNGRTDSDAAANSDRPGCGRR